MGIGTFGRVGAFAASALVAACGGGGGGGNTVALKSEDGVKREVANVVMLYDQGGTAAPMSVSGLAQTRAAAMRARVANGAIPKATTEDCDSGTYTFDSFTNVSRSLPLFSAAPNLDYATYDYNNCLFIEGLYALTQDGYLENGSNNAYSNSSAENPYYGYNVWGSGSGSFVYTIEDAPGFSGAGRSVERARGRSEYRDNGSSVEIREISDFSLSIKVPGFSESITLGAGETGNPLVIADNYVAGTLTIDGPFFYGTAGECSGGRIDYDTVEPLVPAEDGDGTYVSDGELAISSGSVTVTLTFQPDGDISYELSTGATGEITRTELADTAPCGVFFTNP
jgi:hypothetical protein